MTDIVGKIIIDDPVLKGAADQFPSEVSEATVLAIADLDNAANAAALLSNPDAAAFIDANKVCPDPVYPIIYARPQHGVQTTSYEEGDEADLAESYFNRGDQIGKVQRLDYTQPIPMKSLLYNDPVFDQKNRFTDEDGDDCWGIDAVNFRFDHLQGIILDTVDFIADNRRTIGDAWTIAQAKSETLNGKVYSDWLLLPAPFAINLIDEQQDTDQYRIKNTLGEGVIVSTNTRRSNDRVYYIGHTSSAHMLNHSTAQFNFVYMAFIEDGVAI